VAEAARDERREPEELLLLPPYLGTESPEPPLSSEVTSSLFFRSCLSMFS
jgi:hypothetical protein